MKAGDKMVRIQKGVNDLESWCLNNGEFGQKLMTEWTGVCEDGNQYTIDQVARASNKKFRWRCQEGHEWLAKINSRTLLKQSCPYCQGKRVSDENSLKAWCLSNGDFGQRLLSEWTGICEDGRHYKIDEVSFGSSHKKFKWICSKGHEWYAMVYSRTSLKRGCLRCLNTKPKKGVNDLETWCLNNGSFGEQLKSEWTGICEDGAHYKIDEVSFGSYKKFKWKCSKRHEWLANVKGRTAQKHGCPYCSGRYVSSENSLKTWCLSNGSFGKQLMNEWTGECEDGTHYEMNEVARASQKRFKWTCSKGHEWLATVSSRTYQKQGCPYCNNRGTSYAEQFIFWSLKQLFPNTETRCKVLRSTQNPQGIEFDIGIPDIPLCVEYSPTRWHKGNEERDQYKKDLCNQRGIRLIQIVEDSYNQLEHTTSDDYICFKMNERYKDDILTKIVDRILKSLGRSISEIDLELAKQKAWDYSKNQIDYKESLAGVYPELAKEWHPALNDNLKPNEIKCGSHKIVYWQCPICNHGSNGEWQATVHTRAHGKTGCPKCGHNWYKAQQGLPQRYKGLYSYLNDQENSKSK